jgi:CheY-like chemotaxis protein
LDIALQDMDGFEVVRQLKSDPVTQYIPSSTRPQCSVTTSIGGGDSRQGLRSTEEYLMEPFEPEVLVTVVRRVLGHRDGTLTLS